MTAQFIDVATDANFVDELLDAVQAALLEEDTTHILERHDAHRFAWKLAPLVTTFVELAAVIAHRNLHLHFSPVPGATKGFVATLRRMPQTADAGGRILGVRQGPSPMAVLREIVDLARSLDS